jgi:hypothetical protein
MANAEHPALLFAGAAKWSEPEAHPIAVSIPSVLRRAFRFAVQFPTSPAQWRRKARAIYSAGRISIFIGVALEGVWEEQMPASVAPERFQAHQSLVSGTTPKLARPFESTLVLSAG